MELITVGDHAWLFLVLAEGIARTLTEKEGSLNIAPFEIASFAVETDKNLAVLTPERGEIALSLPALENRLSFSGTGDLGSYVFLGGEKQKTLGGFSVNPRAEQLRLDPLSFDELQDLFGKTRLNRIDSARSSNAPKPARSRRPLQPFGPAFRSGSRRGTLLGLSALRIGFILTETAKESILSPKDGKNR